MEMLRCPGCGREFQLRLLSRDSWIGLFKQLTQSDDDTEEWGGIEDWTVEDLVDWLEDQKYLKLEKEA